MDGQKTPGDPVLDSDKLSAWLRPEVLFRDDLDCDIIAIDDHTWAIHGSIPVNGEVIIAEFDRLEEAEEVLMSLRPDPPRDGIEPDDEGVRALAARAGVSADLVRRLVDLEIVAPASDGTFVGADVHKVRFVEAADRGGLPVEASARAIREGRFSLAFLEGSQYRWAPLSSRTYADVAEEFGFPVDEVLAFEEALGKVRPAPDDRAPEDVVEMLGLPRVAMAAGVDWQTHARVLRIYAESLGRIAETEGDVFHRLIEMPRLEAGLSHRTMLDEVNRVGVELAPEMERVLLAVYRRQQERVWTSDGVRHLESAVEAMGLYEVPERPTAFAFVDLTGYTRLTEERGDRAGARLATDLAELVHEEVGRRDGRAVKWLGDGIMSSFPDACEAVLATIGIGVRAVELGLPPAHAGIAAGPVIFQDGEYYGRTVNRASRLAGAAGPGQTLVDEDVVTLSAARDDVAFRRLEPVFLKGVAQPVDVYEAVRPPEQ
jgi:adenylate cyclase